MSRNNPNGPTRECDHRRRFAGEVSNVNRAIETSSGRSTGARHIGLREKLREILIDAGRRDQLLSLPALASLHISAGDVESANARLLEAKRLDPRVSVTGQLRDVGKPRSSAPLAEILSGTLQTLICSISFRSSRIAG